MFQIAIIVYLVHYSIYFTDIYYLLRAKDFGTSANNLTCQYCTEK